MAVNYTHMNQRMSNIAMILEEKFETHENQHGEKYWRFDFGSEQALESFFVDQILYIKGYSSKAINTVLLVFEKNYG